VVAAIDAGALEFAVGFEAVRFDVARFDVVRSGVSDETLLAAMLLPVSLVVLLVRLLAIANPASGALADRAVALVASVVASLLASEERDRAGVLSRVAELDVGDGSAAEKLRDAELTALGSNGEGLIGAGLIGAERTGAKSTGVELPGAKSPTLASLDWRAAGCLAVDGSVRSARLFWLMGNCSVGIGDGMGVNAGVGAEEAGETMLETGLVGGAGPWLRSDKATGWSEELLRVEMRTEDDSAFGSGVADVGSAGLNEAAGADGDRTVGV